MTSNICSKVFLLEVTTEMERLAPSVFIEISHHVIETICEFLGILLALGHIMFIVLDVSMLVIIPQINVLCG